MPPGDLVGWRVGLDRAREVDVVSLLQVPRVQVAAEGEVDLGGNWKKKKIVTMGHLVLDGLKS